MRSDAQSSAEKGSKSLLIPGSPCLPCLAPVRKKIGAALVVDRMRAHGLPMHGHRRRHGRQLGMY